jgi:hypothetical protein
MIAKLNKDVGDILFFGYVIVDLNHRLEVIIEDVGMLRPLQFLHLSGGCNTVIDSPGVAHFCRGRWLAEIDRPPITSAPFQLCVQQCAARHKRRRSICCPDLLDMVAI